MNILEQKCGLCESINEIHHITAENDYAISVVALHVVNSTHQIILPKRHIIALKDTTENEAKGIFDLQYQVQQRLFELYPNHPPIIAIQTGKHATQFHIHWQAYCSDAHIKLLYVKSHEIYQNEIGGRFSGDWKDKRTHPEVPRSNFLEDIANSLKGTGNINLDREQLKELTYELLRYNEIEI